MKRNGTSPRPARLIAKVYANPRYRGKWVIVIHGSVVPRRHGMAGVRQLKTLLERYPKDTPTVVYVPKAEALILLA